jgi:hypothetical protein
VGGKIESNVFPLQGGGINLLALRIVKYSREQIYNRRIFRTQMAWEKERKSEEAKEGFHFFRSGLSADKTKKDALSCICYAG